MTDHPTPTDTPGQLTDIDALVKRLREQHDPQIRWNEKFPSMRNDFVDFRLSLDDAAAVVRVTEQVGAMHGNLTGVMDALALVAKERDAALQQLRSLRDTLERLKEAWSKGARIEHSMTCPAWGPGSVGRTCRCGVDDLAAIFNQEPH